MRVRAAGGPPATVDADVLAVPIYREDAEMTGDLAELDAASGGAISRAIEWGEFNAVEHASALVGGGGPCGPPWLLSSMPATRGRGAWRARRLAAAATRRLNGRGAKSMALWLRDGEAEDAWTAAASGAVAGTYRATDIYGRARDTDAMKRSVADVLCIGAGSQAALDRGVEIGEGMAFGRDLANRSANDLSPERMAEVARELTADGCTVEILEPKEMEALGMGLLLGVGQGSAHPPRLVVIKLPGWQAGGDRRLAIVGKGVCFDSGGISLKPAEGMGEMKHDKSGAAAVIAAARTVARIAPQTPLMAVAPMVENMPSGSAQRPGDVVKAMNGKTIEVTNTDAEGRLILADALTWAERQGATHIVDVATLTGAARRWPSATRSARTSRVRASGATRSRRGRGERGSGSGRCHWRPSTATASTRRTPTSSTRPPARARSSRAPSSCPSSSPSRGCTSTSPGRPTSGRRSPTDQRAPRAPPCPPSFGSRWASRRADARKGAPSRRTGARSV